ncbi:MAG: hypothetical protein HN608_00300, partial [Rhodospirillaceae bacterium]|nr:hypothetical protein [Rhodospirillaceae bacterium]
DDLILLLNDGALTPEHRLGALHGLATIGNDSAVDALISVIDDETRAIRLETMSALARMARNAPIWPNPAGDALLSALQGHYTPIGETEPDTKPEPASPPKLELVKTDTIVETRPSASTAASPPTSTMEAILADIPEAREVLDMPEEGALLTPMDMERLALAKQTKRKKRIALTPNVVLHEDIRRFAARVLGDVHQIDVAAALADGLKANDGEVRTAAADSLARIGAHLRPLPDSIAKTVIAAMTTADRDMKLPLIRILAACGKDTVVETVTGYLNDTDSFLRVEAVRALAILGGIGAEIGVLLNDADPAVRLCAAEAIAGTGQDNAVAPLVEFAFTYEGYHGRATARLLRDLDADRASDLFRAALDDAAKKRVWSVAIEALEELHCRPNSRQLV